MTDAHDQYAMLAVQGPQAREIVQALADGPLPDRFTCRHRLLRGQRVLVCGTGYTGEDGVELLIDPADAPMIWDEVVTRGAVPAGLAARDTLRLEVGYHLYGNDLMEERGPIEAGLGWACKEETGFIGSEAVARGPRGRPGREARRLHDGLRHRPPGQPGRRRRRGDVGHDVAVAGDRDRHGLRPAAMAAEGTELQIDVRGKQRAAAVAKKPLYKK